MHYAVPCVFSSQEGCRMTESVIELTVKQLPETTVAGVRRWVSSEGAILTEIATLREMIGDTASGPPISLYLDRNTKRGLDVQIVFPVRRRVVDNGIHTWTLPGDYVLSTTYVGPLDGTADRPGLDSAIRRLWTEIAVPNRLLLGDNPRRSVYLEGPETHGEDVSRYQTEIQISYHFPVWVEALRSGVASCAGDEAANHVVAGGEKLYEVFNPDRLRGWVRGAIARLDEAVPDERTRACLMNGCAHPHPKPQLERLRAAYRESGDLGRFVERLEMDKTLYPPRVWREPDRPSVLYVERTIPYPDERDATDDPIEKRFHTCFCSMVKDAILRGEEISPTFCHCSAGWFVQIWEAILDRRLRVDVVQDVLHGADRCVFAVHLPKELLSRDSSTNGA